ncbi:transposase, partial [Venenivibrio stagnispumantis]|nr:transposase [Venenivibrio stagnispumantis]
ERFSPNGSTALFGCQCCGYIINADINAVFNQFFIYLSYLLNAGREDGSVVPLGVSLKSSSKRRTKSKG